MNRFFDFDGDKKDKKPDLTLVLDVNKTFLEISDIIKKATNNKKINYNVRSEDDKLIIEIIYLE